MHQLRYCMNNQHNDLTYMIVQAHNEAKIEMGERFDLTKVNLADLERRTGLSRVKLRHIKENGFVVMPHALIGQKAERTVLSGFTGIIDSLLRKSAKNSNVIPERLQENGYAGGKNSVKDYARNHKNLLPLKRKIVAPQGNRGRRYETKPGKCYIGCAYLHFNWIKMPLNNTRTVAHFKLRIVIMLRCSVRNRRLMEIYFRRMLFRWR